VIYPPITKINYKNPKLLILIGIYHTSLQSELITSKVIKIEVE